MLPKRPLCELPGDFKLGHDNINVIFVHNHFLKLFLVGRFHLGLVARVDHGHGLKERRKKEEEEEKKKKRKRKEKKRKEEKKMRRR